MLDLDSSKLPLSSGAVAFPLQRPNPTAEFKTDLSPAMFPATPRPEKALEHLTTLCRFTDYHRVCDGCQHYSFISKYS